MGYQNGVVYDGEGQSVFGLAVGNLNLEKAIKLKRRRLLARHDAVFKIPIYFYF